MDAHVRVRVKVVRIVVGCLLDRARGGRRLVVLQHKVTEQARVLEHLLLELGVLLPQLLHLLGGALVRDGGGGGARLGALLLLLSAAAVIIVVLAVAVGALEAVQQRVVGVDRLEELLLGERARALCLERLLHLVRRDAVQPRPAQEVDELDHRVRVELALADLLLEREAVRGA